MCQCVRVDILSSVCPTKLSWAGLSWAGLCALGLLPCLFVCQVSVNFSYSARYPSPALQTTVGAYAHPSGPLPEPVVAARSHYYNVLASEWQLYLGNTMATILSGMHWSGATLSGAQSRAGGPLGPSPSQPALALTHDLISHWNVTCHLTCFATCRFISVCLPACLADYRAPSYMAYT